MAATKKQQEPSESKCDRHLNSIWFGNGYLTKAKAYREALKLCNN